MPLLLTVAQIEAIDAGNRILQSWEIAVPQSAISATFNSRTIHFDGTSLRCVVDPGTREWEMYNRSLRVPGNMNAMTYDIVADNSGGLFYPTTAGNWFYNLVTSYQAPQTLCRLIHRVYVMLAAGYPSQILEYTGRIRPLEYPTDALLYDGSRIRAAAVIRTEAIGAADVLEDEWSVEDGDDDPVNGIEINPTGV